LKVPAITVRDLHHGYGLGPARRDVLRGLDLDVRPGEVVVLSGVSGAGKSTLLTLCGAMQTVQKGRVHVLGRDLAGLGHADRREVRASIGFIFQSHHLIDALTAGQNVVMSLLGQMPAREAVARAESALGRLGLGGRGDALPETLSGGEKQRVAVARALVRYPALILADEPTASLDDGSAHAVLEAISGAARQWGSAVLLVTHDARVNEIASRHVMLVDGVLTERLAARPRLLHAAGL
jgi:putative ABC transport system ATP-binding protein